MICRLLGIIEVLDRVQFVLDGRGDYNWAYRADVFLKARNRLAELGDAKSAMVMDRFYLRETRRKNLKGMVFG